MLAVVYLSTKASYPFERKIDASVRAKSWEKAEEEASLKLANQLENVFRIYSAKGELKLFSGHALK